MAKQGGGWGIKLSGLEDVIKELRVRDLDVKAGLVAICGAGAQVVEGDSGSRRGGCRMRRCDGWGRSARRVAVDVGFVRKQSFIARFLEFGTKPHIIKCAPKARGEEGALFQWRLAAAGESSGARKQPFIRPGFEAATGEATDAIGRETKRVLRA